MRNVTLIALAALPAAAWLTGLVRRVALARGMLDVPNSRSSHQAPTPRGGGVAIVLVAATGFVALALAGSMSTRLLASLLGGGGAVAVVGFLDDRLRVSPRVRLLVHLGAAVWAVSWLGGLPQLGMGAQAVQLSWIGGVIAVLGIVWVLNLFNFMDGIDGIAGSEGTFVAWAGALLGVITGHAGGASAAAWVLGAASLGFLVWNWPPAKIFMGDAGSGFSGYVIAVIALAAIHEDADAFWVWLTLGGVFFIDATVTLARRLVRGERLHEAHRSHAYQWLSRRWGSHGRVTLAVLLVDAFWLLPCAVFASLHPSLVVVTTLIALAPLVALALAAGSGRPEQPDRARS